MSKISTGGPAFPVPLTDEETWIGEETANGMSLRDYFAAKALPIAYKYWIDDFYHPESASRIAHGDEPRDGLNDMIELIAGDAYELADAMLKARNE